MERGNIAEFIKDLRIERSWSQDLLAQNAGVSKRTIQRLEKEGQCSHETLLAVAGAFDIDVRELTRFSAPSRVAVQDYPSMQTNEIEFSMPGSLIKWANKFPMVNKRFYKNMATTGLALMVIPLLFIAVNLLKYTFGFSSLLNPFDLIKSIPFLHQIITSPVFLVGSLVVALGLNALPLVNLNVKKEEEELTGSFSIKGNRWNAMIVGASLFFMTFMMGYSAVENISEQATSPFATVVEGSFLPQEVGATTPEETIREELNELPRRAEANYEEAKVMEAEFNGRAPAITPLEGALALDETKEPQEYRYGYGGKLGTQVLVRSLKSQLSVYSSVMTSSVSQLSEDLKILKDSPDEASLISNLPDIESSLAIQQDQDRKVLQMMTFFEELIVGDYQGDLLVNGDKIAVTKDNGLNQAIENKDALESTFVILQHQLEESIIQQRELLEWIKIKDSSGLDSSYLIKKMEAIKTLKESNVAQAKKMINIVS